MTHDEVVLVKDHKQAGRQSNQSLIVIIGSSLFGTHVPKNGSYQEYDSHSEVDQIGEIITNSSNRWWWVRRVGVIGREGGETRITQ